MSQSSAQGSSSSRKDPLSSNANDEFDSSIDNNNNTSNMAHYITPERLFLNKIREICSAMEGLTENELKGIYNIESNDSNSTFLRLRNGDTLSPFLFPLLPNNKVFSVHLLNIVESMKYALESHAMSFITDIIDSEEGENIDEKVGNLSWVIEHLQSALPSVFDAQRFVLDTRGYLNLIEDIFMRFDFPFILCWREYFDKFAPPVLKYYIKNSCIAECKKWQSVKQHLITAFHSPTITKRNVGYVMKMISDLGSSKSIARTWASIEPHPKWTLASVLYMCSQEQQQMFVEDFKDAFGRVNASTNIHSIY